MDKAVVIQKNSGRLNPIRRRWIPWLLFALGLAVFGCLNGLSSSAAASSSGRFQSVWPVVISSLITWSLWLPLTPVILWIGRKFSFDRERPVRSVLIYLLAGALLSFIHLALQTGINFGFVYGFRALVPFVTYRYFVLISNYLTGLVVFGLILAVGMALNYYGQYREEELKASQLESQLSQSQLQALKMQLHPHFLFNTLNSISALQLVDTRAAQKMMARLGDFLRMTLDNSGDQEVTLKQELEFLECYLEIERTRFGERLATHFAVTPDTLDARVPNLILQPIVENAIRHGVAPHLAPAVISIFVQRQNGILRMQVRDNGQGVPIGVNGNPNFTEGLGLANTRSRLERLYGAAARFHLQNADEGGLVVTLEIPFVSGSEN